MVDGRIFSARLRGRRKSIIRELEPITRVPGVISLGAGFPSPATFGLEMARFQLDGHEITLDAAERERACQYGPTAGDPRLVELLLAWHRYKSGVALAPGELLVLSGSQEGLFGIACLVLDPGDAVVLAEPAYPGALSSFSLFTEELLGVPQDEEGLVPAELSRVLATAPRPPKLLYVNPTCQNPAGVTMGAARRRELLSIAAAHDLLVVEDDAYELLGFDAGPRPPTLQSLDRDGRVLRLDSFSKVLAPGFRIGYASGPRWLIDELNILKQSSALQSSSLDQVVLARALEAMGERGLIERVTRSREHYRRSCDALRQALDRHLGRHARYQPPAGGFFLWLELDEAGGRIDTYEMMRSSGAAAGVLLMPGSGFALKRRLSNCLRIAFSLQPPDALEEGIRRLSRLLDRRDA